MKTLRNVLIGALILGAPSLLRAQRVVGFDTEAAIAATYCTPRPDGTVSVVTLMNMDLLKNKTLLEEVTIHEITHQDQYQTRPEICDHRTRTSADVLWMEVGAYCASFVVSVKNGLQREDVFTYYWQLMLQQFAGFLTPAEVTWQWTHECSFMLARATPDGTQVSP